MNAVQFGRWFSERRRAGGWSSQRLLAEATQQHTILCQSGISEDFLSRLEAGHLAYPFRGTVRRRILLLAWLLCKTSRDLKTYLKAIGLKDCGDEEKTQIHLLSEHLTIQQAPPPLLLPVRPFILQGREAELERLHNALSNPETRIFALTGMPGVGKSVLAHEVLHRLAIDENERLRRFPDGIATFTCTGRQGMQGLASLLVEITALFTANTYTTRRSMARQQTGKRARSSAGDLPFGSYESEPELASIIDRARAALANKRALLLLDDLDPTFPLRLAIDVLLTQGTQTFHEAKAEHGHEQRVILTTSQFLPAPALVSARLHIQPLSEDAAVELLGKLLNKELSELDRVQARQACATVGYLPLAIENMATAVQTNGIPLALVSTHLMAHPLGRLLDSAEEVAKKMEKALAGLEREARTAYLLLAALELSTFDLETAAAALAPRRVPMSDLQFAEKTVQGQFELANAGGGTGIAAPRVVLTASTTTEPEKEKLAYLADTAAVLGQFVRLSLLELAPYTPGNDIHYAMHALLYHYARTMAHTLPDERLELARYNLLAHTHLPSS